MSVDKLQEKIRKQKNPSVVNFDVLPEHIPPHLLEEEGNYLKAYGRFCEELLEGLEGVVPAVRFGFSSFALFGPEGLKLLGDVLRRAKDRGFYVLLHVPEALSYQGSAAAAQVLCAEECSWPFDGLIVSSYIGSDGLRPYVSGLKKNGKSLFAVVRTANKTAPELQDLLTGTRLLHVVAADIVNHLAEPLTGRSGYSQVAAVAAASSADSLRSLRAKYKNLFLLLDGYDYPNSNAKNCSFAFDKLGHGAAACAGNSITAAWIAEESDGHEYVTQAVNAAERMKKNLTRYITIL